MTTGSLPIRTGLSRVLSDGSLIPRAAVGLCTNYTAVNDDLGRGVDSLLDAGVRITALLTPEHGYWGAVQAGSSEGDGTDPSTGLPVLDTYRLSGEPLDALLRDSGIDQLVVDLQDIGTRFYTYTWTLYDLMCSAARIGMPVTVLDRPNPLGGLRAGPGLDPGLSSFVGRVSIPIQHGLSLGELARWFNASHVPAETGTTADLSVVALQGWHRRRATCQEPWVLPSPNVPTLTTAVLYPATGLLEGTTLSEGRGTTRPFELFGAPWTDPRLASALRGRDLPGVTFREAVFRPTFGTWAGETIHGAQIHLLDPDAFDPIGTAVTVLGVIAELYPGHSLWREAVDGRPHFIDLLWGSPALREGIDARDDLESIVSASPAAPAPPAEALLYTGITEDPR